MIRVDRTQVAVPSSCKGPNCPSEQEFKLAQNHYSPKNNATKSYDFDVYRNDDIKESLNKLFHGKCAYCETQYKAAQPMDVEHYRPKGRIRKEGVKGYIFPGYWWLAATWGNLLPSCVDCNRERNYKQKGGISIVYGKGSRFPLETGTNLDRVLGQEKTEIPLLVNPTVDNPDDFFFHKITNLKSTFIITISALSTNQLTKKRAETSIECYGLNRHPLVEARSDHIKRLYVNLRHIEKSIGHLNRIFNQTDIDDTILEINESIQELKEVYLLATSPYSAACNAFFNSWKSRITDARIRT